MDGRLFRAARAILGLTQIELCSEAKISRATLNDLERGRGDPRQSSFLAVEDAFKRRGIVFMREDDRIGLYAPRVPVVPAEP